MVRHTYTCSYDFIIIKLPYKVRKEILCKVLELRSVARGGGGEAALNPTCSKNLAFYYISFHHREKCPRPQNRCN